MATPQDGDLITKVYKKISNSLVIASIYLNQYAYRLWVIREHGTLALAIIDTSAESSCSQRNHDSDGRSDDQSNDFGPLQLYQKGMPRFHWRSWWTAPRHDWTSLKQEMGRLEKNTRLITSVFVVRYVHRSSSAPDDPQWRSLSTTSQPFSFDERLVHSSDDAR